MARAFAEKGMRLALADTNHSQLISAQQQLSQAGHEALIFPLDVCDRDALKAATAATTLHFGALHVVCANAGVAGFIGPLQNGQDRDWDWMDRDGSMWKQVRDASGDYDAYYARLVEYHELGCNRRNSNARLDDITES